MSKVQWSEYLKNSKHKILYLFIFLFCGICLMLIPNNSEDGCTNKTDSFTMNYSIEKEEERLEEILSAIKGVEKCKVLLSVHNDGEIILAEDEGETVILSGGGKQSTITVETRYPSYHGAVIVSGGCDDATVRYDILSAVMAYTGLTVDRITICPINNS